MATGSARAKRTDPKLWEKVKARVMRGSKGGDAGEWSARKAQLAVQEYKKAGGGYEGGRSEANHLRQWEKEDWGTRSGHKSGETGERYLPRKAREALTDEEYARTTAAKRRDTAKGRQFSRQPADVARKTAASRRATAKTTKRAASTAPKRTAGTTKRKTSTTAKRKTGTTAKRATGATAKRATSATPKRATAARKTSSAARKPAAAKAPSARKAAPAKRPAPKKAPARRAAAARASTPTRRARPAPARSRRT